jgi:triosephosphate isomerase
MTARPPVIAGNWKMHLTAPEARALAGQVVAAAGRLAGVKFILAPPFTALAAVAEVVEGSPVGLAAQNLHWEDKGAFTGEVSGPMLTDTGCLYVLVGHSERRQFFGETESTPGPSEASSWPMSRFGPSGRALRPPPPRPRRFRPSSEAGWADNMEMR